MRFAAAQALDDSERILAHRYPVFTGESVRQCGRIKHGCHIARAIDIQCDTKPVRNIGGTLQVQVNDVLEGVSICLHGIQILKSKSGKYGSSKEFGKVHSLFCHGDDSIQIVFVHFIDFYSLCIGSIDVVTAVVGISIHIILIWSKRGRWLYSRRICNRGLFIRLLCCVRITLTD